jgi:hypothetical protein
VDGSIPTTRLALAFPSSLAALLPSGTAEAAILVMLIDDVFVASIASGRSCALNEANIDCFSGSDSDTAYSFVRVVNTHPFNIHNPISTNSKTKKKKKEKTHLDNHVYIPQALQPHLGRHDLYPLPCVLGVVRRDTALADVLREQLVNQRKPLGDLLARAVVQQDGDFGAGRGDEGDAGAWQSMCQCGQGGGCEKEEELPIWPAPRTPSVLIPCAMDMLRLRFYLQSIV